MIDQERLARLATMHLSRGSGSAERNDGCCVMNVVDWLAGGDGTSDKPACVDPVIAQFAISLNDAKVFAAYRDDLKAYVVRMVDTRGSAATSRHRGYLCADWAVRTIAPIVLDAEWAARLRALPPVVDVASAQEAVDLSDAARVAASYAAAAVAACANDAARCVATSDADNSANIAAYADNVAALYTANVATYAANVAAARFATRVAADAVATVVNAADVADKRLVWDAALHLLGDLIDARSEAGR